MSLFTLFKIVATYCALKAMFFLQLNRGGIHVESLHGTNTFFAPLSSVSQQPCHCTLRIWKHPCFISLFLICVAVATVFTPLSCGYMQTRLTSLLNVRSVQ